MARKVLVEVKGGLGNQLFQYAAGLELATALKSDLIFDTRLVYLMGRWLSGTRRKFGLEDLGLKIRNATSLDLLLADSIKTLTSKRLTATFPKIIPY